MSRKQLVAEIIYTTLIRGFLMLFAAFICTFVTGKYFWRNFGK